MPQNPAIPHLEEAYALAQCIAPGRAAAIDLCLRAYDALAELDRGRFSVLRAIVRISGLMPGRPVEPGSGPEPQLGDGDPMYPDRNEGLSVVGILAGRELRNRLLPSVLGTLSHLDRTLVWLAAAGITSGADLARILDVEPDQAGSLRFRAEATLQLHLMQSAELHERPLLAAAERAEPTREATRRMFETLLEPVPAGLRQRLAPATSAETDRSDARRDRGSPLRRMALILAIVLAAAAVGYGIQTLRPDSEPTLARASDAVRSAVELARGAEPVFRTSSGEQAEVFVRDRLDWSIVTPIIDGHPLEGVGVVELDAGMEIPVLFYGESAGDAVVVVVYTYAFLDRAAPVLYLDRDLRRQISEPGRFGLLDAGRTKALIFRNRDDIFVAVTAGDADALQNAISFPG